MIFDRSINYYFLTNPEDYELLYDSMLEAWSKGVYNQAFLMDPIFIDYEKPETYLVAYGVYAFAVRFMSGPWADLKTRVKTGLKVSETLRNLESIIEGVQDVDEAVWMALIDTGVVGSSYGKAWIQTPHLDMSHVKLAVEQGKKEGALVLSGEKYKEYMKYFYQNMVITGTVYLTKLGFCRGKYPWGSITVSRTPEMYARIPIYGSYRSFEELTKVEKVGTITLKDCTVISAYPPVYESIPDSSPLKEEMKQYLPKPENIKNIEQGMPEGNEREYFYIYKGWVLQNAIENKLYLCSEETILRDYGLRAFTFNNSKAVPKLEYKQTLQEINKGLYDMANILGIPEQSIGKGHLALTVQKDYGRSSALAYYSSNCTEIVLYQNKGYGSFAHEWFHYLDNMMNREAFAKKGVYYTYASIAKAKQVLKRINPEEYELASNFFTSITKDDSNKSLVFYRESGKSGRPTYHKDPTEVLARVGSKVVMLKMKREGIQDSICFDNVGESYPHVPQGEEVKYLEPKIDWLIGRAKELGVV